MKKLILTPLTFLIRILRQSVHETFLSGLVFGALFSLIVNVLTIQLQENIQRQRIFEAVENEIAANARLASRTAGKNTERITQKEMPNFFDSISRYSNTVWGTSDGTKYIVQLSGELQGSIISYYDILIPRHNQLISKYEQLADKYLDHCYFDTEELSEFQYSECVEWYKLILTGEMETARAVGRESYALLDTFHPTKDRLSNPILRLLMGDKALGMLSGN